MALDAFSSAVQNFARFGQQRLANQEQQQQIELNQMKLDSNRADKAINELTGTGLVSFNADTNSYDVAPDWFDKLQQVPESERQSLLAGVQSYLGAYEDNGKIEVGEISNVAPVKGKLPTSLKDASEEEKQAWLSDPKNIAYSVPIKRKDGRFSFLTRDRSSAPEDDEAIILSGAEVASWIGARANKLNRLKNPEEFRRAQILTQNRDSLAVTGTGQSGTTYDSLMDELTNDLDRIETNPEIAGTGAQTDSLGALLGSWQSTIDETLKTQYNQQNIATATADKQAQLEDAENRLSQATKVRDYKRIQKEIKELEKDLPLSDKKVAALNKRKETLLSQKVENPKTVAERRSNMVKDRQIKKIDEELKGQTVAPVPAAETDFPDAPDLSNIKTEEQALELLDSGVLNSFLSDEVIEKSRSVLQEQGVTDSQSFNQAVQDNKIKNPYVHSLVIASAIAGPDATDSEVRAQALELFNNIKTGDPQAGPRQLTADKINAMDTKADYLRWFATQSQDYKDEIKETLSDIDDAWDRTTLAYTSKEKDANYEGEYINALTSTVGFLNDLQLSGVKDPLGYIKKVMSNTTYQKIANGLSTNIYESLGSNWNIFSADFWGDIPRQNNPKALTNLINTMGTIVDSEGKVTKFVRIKRIGGRIIEVEGSDTPINVLNRADPDAYNALIRMLPVVNRQGDGEQE
tara:strand:- start:458 stop:2530 length:2073 start_codon:yes stop_codon:yes gene_type:complete